MKMEEESDHSTPNPNNSSEVSGDAGNCTSSKEEKIALNTLGEAKSVVIRAEEVQSNLDPKFPSFVKHMLRSHVTLGFWLGMPQSFCKSHMPRKDIMVKLEDEDGARYDAKFLAEKTAISGGWKQFSIAHKLIEGDVVIFQLVEPSLFKIYIIKENECINSADEGEKPSHLNAYREQNQEEIGSVVCNYTKRKRCSESSQLGSVQKRNTRRGRPRSTHKLLKLTKQFKNDGNNIGVEVLDGSRLPDSWSMMVNEEGHKEGEEKEMMLPDPDHEVLQEEDHLTLAQMSKTSRTFISTPKPKSLSPVISEQSGECTSSPAKKLATKAAGRTPLQAKSSAIIRAEEVQSNLETEFPSFIKSMIRSHVSSCFWLGLPGSFCKSHMPGEVTIMTLTDEHGGTYEVNYIPEKSALSGGWRLFSIRHNLLEGDVLVFQLIEPLKFKVHIIRANDLTTLNEAHTLTNLECHTNENDEETDAFGFTVVKRKKTKQIGLRRLPRKRPKFTNQTEHCENDSENGMLIESSKIPVSVVPMKEFIDYDDFHITVNGMLIDSELSEDIRTKYYNLCCSQKAFLHDSLLKGVNLKLIGGVISETVNISEALRACKLTTTEDEFKSWEQTLKGLEVFGINVSFLQARLNCLLSLALDSEGATVKQKYREAQNGLAHRQEEIRNLEAKLAELKEESDDMENWKLKLDSYELKFREEATARW